MRQLLLSNQCFFFFVLFYLFGQWNNFVCVLGIFDTVYTWSLPSWHPAFPFEYFSMFCDYVDVGVVVYSVWMGIWAFEGTDGLE